MTSISRLDFWFWPFTDVDLCRDPRPLFKEELTWRTQDLDGWI